VGDFENWVSGVRKSRWKVSINGTGCEDGMCMEHICNGILLSNSELRVLSLAYLRHLINYQPLFLVTIYEFVYIGEDIMNSVLNPTE
jgi:hypothetical protein